MKLMLQELRKAAGLSQQEIAEALGIPRRTYGSYERGERSINLKLAAAICNVLGCTPNDLVGWPMDGLTSDESDLVKSYKACDTPHPCKRPDGSKERRSRICQSSGANART